jgi:hypothetical protein
LAVEHDLDWTCVLASAYKGVLSKRESLDLDDVPLCIVDDHDSVLSSMESDTYKTGREF